MRASVWMGLTLLGKEVDYRGYRRCLVRTENIEFSEDTKALVIKVSCQYGIALADWGAVDGFFVSATEEGGHIYADVLERPIPTVPKGRQFELVTYLTCPFTNKSK